MAKAPSAASQAARGRRASRGFKQDVSVEFFTDKILKNIRTTMKTRMGVAVEFLRSKIVKNISIPVETTTDSKGQRVVTVRSKPGEYPRKDIGNLKDTLLTNVAVFKGFVDGEVGTPLDYGLILEVNKRLNRKFLTRTLKEEKLKIVQILGAPIIGF